MSKFLFALAIALPYAHAWADDQAAPRVCDHYLIPTRVDRLLRSVENARDPAGVADRVAREVVASASFGGRESIQFEEAGYTIRVRARVTRHRVAVQVERIFSSRKYEKDLTFPRPSLRSPLLDVWRGVLLGTLELIGQTRSAHLVTIKGKSMYNLKLASLIKRRLGFRYDDFGYGATVFLWRSPTPDSKFTEKLEFRLRAVSEFLRTRL